MDNIKKPPERHNPVWATAFLLVRDALLRILGNDAIAIHHIGSTAISGILAKPVIDVLIEATSLEAIDARKADFAKGGFVGKGEYGIKGRRFFIKNNAENVRSHHIHVFQRGSPHLERHLAFRDYLRANPECASAYSRVKEAILADWQGFDDYIARKSSFVAVTERAALEWARRRADGGGEEQL